MSIPHLVKINTNWYAVDGIEVIEVKPDGVLYQVVIHMKSGKTFIAFKDLTFEDALKQRSEIVEVLIESIPDE